MSVHLNRKLVITLLFSLALLLAFARPSSANAISPDSPSRRDHHNLNRMIKRRVAAPPVARAISSNDPGGAIGAGANPPEDSSSPSTPSSTPSSPSPSAVQPSSLVASSSSTLLPSLVASSSTVESSSSSLSRSLSSSISSTTPTTTSTSSSSSTLSTPSTSDTPTPTTQQDTPLTTGNAQPVSVDSVTLTSHVAAASSSAAASNAQLGASSLSHTTVTILIVLAASIGGCAIIWTIIRKWKFRPSDKFEDRLEPVNWQPTEHDSGLPTHRRMTSNASSFHSAGHDNMGLSRSNSGGVYNAGRGLSPLPDHDFTAGAATLAPGGGYADLARGPSPQPQMQEALHRGPSVNRGYGDYPDPTHQYQGGREAYDYGNSGPRY